MAQKIIDLDAVAGPDKIVKLGGKQWRLPGDLPVELYLRLNRFAEEQESDAADPAVITELRERLLELFRERQPKLEALPPIGMRTLIEAIGTIYADDSPVEDEPAPDPQPRRSTKASGKPKTSRKSASSTS